MAETNRILATHDPMPNTVCLSFCGRIGVEQAGRDETAISQVLAQAQPGFNLLTDLTCLESMDIACLPFLARTMELARSRGVERIVRIIPDPAKDIGFNIMSLFHYPRGLPIVTCESRAEAERVLS